MKTPNPFQQAAGELAAARHRPKKTGRVIPTIAGIDAKPLSWFSGQGQQFMLDLIACGELDFVVCDDVLLIPTSEIDPYMPLGHEWNE